MIGLAMLIKEHREAVEYDLLTKTGLSINDVGRVLSWDALGAFVRHIDSDSALAREIKPEVSEWGTRVKTNAILADIFDMLAAMNSNLIAVGSGKRAKKPKKYPRPEQNDGTKRYGKGAMPVDELRKWIEEKRREHHG